VSSQRSPQTPPEFFDLMLAYKNSALLKAGVELGVFELLAQGPSTAATVAQKLTIAERGARLLLNALAALGLLSSDGSSYQLTSSAAKYLVPGQPGYLGDMAHVMVSRWEWEAFGTLPDAVRHGGPVVSEHAETPRYGFWEHMAAFSGAVGRPVAEVTAAYLQPWAANRDRLNILDVGCGHGIFGFTLAAQHAHARVWSLDWPNVLDQTQKHAERFGLSDRSTMVPGDMFEAPLDGPYDVVLIANVMHHFSADRGTALLERLAGAMAPDGRIVLAGFLTHDGPPEQDTAAHLFSVLMLVWTHAGEVHSQETYLQMLRTAGFGSARVQPVPGLPLSIIVAERESADDNSWRATNRIAGGVPA